MKKVLKWLGVGLGAIVLVAVLAVVSMVFISSSGEGKEYAVSPGGVPIPEGAEAIAEGQRLYVARGCAECHGQDGGGAVLMDAPPGLVAGSNLTVVTTDYSPEDWVRSLRHGVGPDGYPLIFMPSHEYYHALSDADVGNLVAYIRSLPASSNTPPQSEIRLLGRILHVTGAMHMLPAELVDHEATRPADVPVAETKEYGERLAAACTGCHGAGFGGGPIPGAPPELGVPRNLTPHETGLAGWTREDFFRALREGKSKDGTDLNPRQMPFGAFRSMTDTELGALWAYISQLPPRELGSR